MPMMLDIGKDKLGMAFEIGLVLHRILGNLAKALSVVILRVPQRRLRSRHAAGLQERWLGRKSEMGQARETLTLGFF